MKLQEAYNLVDSLLFESSPELVAKKLIDKANKYSNSTKNDFLSLYNQIVKQAINHSLPIGNEKLDLTNPIAVNNYINNIKILTNNIANTEAKKAVDNSLEEFKTILLKS